MASRIGPLITPHNVYAEPFCGGGAVMFAKGIPAVTNNHHYREVINDTNKLVYNFYKQLQENGEKLAEKLSLTPYSEQFWRDARDICNNPDDYSEFDRAWGFFVKISQSFGRILQGGWGREIISKNAPHTWVSKVKNLAQYLDRMDKVYVSDTDALQCIQNWDSENTFFYCDPPYVATDQGHYSGYTQADLDELIAVLDNIKGSFILSGYENIRYPESWERFEFKASMSVARDKTVNKKRIEIVLRKHNGKTAIHRQSELWG